jgi:hypothetical protein
MQRRNRVQFSRFGRVRVTLLGLALSSPFVSQSISRKNTFQDYETDANPDRLLASLGYFLQNLWRHVHCPGTCQGSIVHLAKNLILQGLLDEQQCSWTDCHPMWQHRQRLTCRTTRQPSRNSKRPQWIPASKENSCGVTISDKSME